MIEGQIDGSNERGKGTDRLIQILFTPPGICSYSLVSSVWVRYFAGMPVTRTVLAWTDLEWTGSIR
jgi:hypothetical protein